MKGKRVLTTAMVLGAGFLGLVWGYEAGEVAGGGTISGAVKFLGTPPAANRLDITKDKDVCAKKQALSESLIVSSDRGIKNAVVSLTDIAKGKGLAGLNPAPVLSQEGCVFRPHVVLVPAGGALDILNEDGILHNFHSYSTRNPSVNKAQPKFKKKMTEKFEQPELIKVTCDTHSWMNAWIIVAENPYYAVTDENGAFALKDVPPGTYQVKIWHETLGTVTQQVTVPAGAEAEVTVEMGKS